MKRLNLFLIIALFATTTTTTNAQSYANNSSNRSNNSNSLRKDVQELHNFEDKLDQFSYAMQVGDIRSAQRLKTNILHKMEREIIQTRRAMLEPRMHNRTRDYNRYDDQLYSKRKGSNSRQQYSSWVLSDRLEEQRNVFRKFETLNLTRGRRGIVNEDRHRRLMYEFRDTMREEIQLESERNRGNRSRRG